MYIQQIQKNLQRVSEDIKVAETAIGFLRQYILETFPNQNFEIAALSPCSIKLNFFGLILVLRFEIQWA